MKLPFLVLSLLALSFIAVVHAQQQVIHNGVIFLEGDERLEERGVLLARRGKCHAWHGFIRNLHRSGPGGAKASAFCSKYNAKTRTVTAFSTATLTDSVSTTITEPTTVSTQTVTETSTTFVSTTTATSYVFTHTHPLEPRAPAATPQLVVPNCLKGIKRGQLKAACSCIVATPSTKTKTLSATTFTTTTAQTTATVFSDVTATTSTTATVEDTTTSVSVTSIVQIGEPTCDFEAFGFGSFLISQNLGVTARQCQLSCATTPGCQSYQTQAGGMQVCNLFNVFTAGNVQPAPGSGFIFRDIGCNF